VIFRSEEARPITGGVDTHAGTHVAAALDPVGGLLGVREFPATAAGYACLLGWLGGFGTVCLVGIEGTGSYGAGLARHVTAAGIRVGRGSPPGPPGPSPAGQVRPAGRGQRRAGRPVWPGPRRAEGPGRRRGGAQNAVFLRGQIEAIPLPGGSVDVIISNCVINLSTDRPAVFAECFRVLRPGGRLGVSDILADDDLTPAQRIQRGGQVGCLAGAPSFAEYRDGLTRAGFTAITITPTHQVADGVHAAIIRASRP